MSPTSLAGIPDAFWRDPVERAKSDPAAFVAVWQAIDRLPPQQRAAKLLSYRAVQRLRAELVMEPVPA